MHIHDFRIQLARAAREAMKRVRVTSHGHSMRQHTSTSESSEVAGALPVDELAGTQATQLEWTRKQRIDSWRRRVLSKKGARLYAASQGRGDRCSLAMLDAHGMVVAWYDDSKDASRIGASVIDRHVSQFYVQADLAVDLPALNLMSAATCGGNTQQGWRRQPSGGIIWGTTVIEPIVMKDGRLQGFSHSIRPAEGPRADFQLQMPRPMLPPGGMARWRIESAQRRPTYAGVAA